jgi:transcriptional regulator with XRE-family HTH domain
MAFAHACSDTLTYGRSGVKHGVVPGVSWYRSGVSDREPEVESLALVFARNARDLRITAGLKAEHVARAVTDRGLTWAPSRVSELEIGRISPTLPTVMILSAAFADLLGRPIALTEWFAGEGQVALTDTVVVPLAAVRAALSGGPVGLPEPRVSATDLLLEQYMSDRVDPQPLPRGRRKKLWEIWNQSGEAEARAAKALGVDPGALAELMLDAWGHTLSTERDIRAGQGANAQKRGRIARELRDELRKAINNGDR